MIIKRTNPFTCKVNEMDIDVTQDQLEMWEAGQPIQDAMPDLSADEREFIMTGITPDQFDELAFVDERELIMTGITPSQYDELYAEE